MADAPNNPASSYHPVAISRITTNTSFDLDHLLIAGDINNASYVTMKSAHAALSSNFTVDSYNGTHQITVFKAGSSVTGLLMFKNNKYTSYSVSSILHDTMAVKPGIPRKVTKLFTKRNWRNSCYSPSSSTNEQFYLLSISVDFCHEFDSRMHI